MAFEQHDNWNEYPILLPRMRRALDFSIYAALNPRSPSSKIERAIAAIFAIGVAFMVLLSMTFDINPVQRDRARPLEVMALTPVRPNPPRQPPSPEPEAVPAGGMPTQEIPAPPPAHDIISSSRDGILLWVRNRIPSTVPPEIATLPAGIQAGEGHGPIAGSGGNGAYDPYAGAAPMHHDSNSNPPSPDDALPRSFGAELNSGLAARLTGHHGRALCQINFDPTGAVISADCSRVIGTASKSLIQQSLVGLTIDRTLMENDSASGWVSF